MASPSFSFDDAAAYERFMGVWSSLIGARFFDWLSVPAGGIWLDVGCGTGSLTRLITDAVRPVRIVGIDTSREQIEYARARECAPEVEFLVADAQDLPFASGLFDGVASGLVLNFIPNRCQALAEMRRVTRPGGLIAAYVWDTDGHRSGAWPIQQALRKEGVDPPPIPGSSDTRQSRLAELFAEAGMLHVETTSVEVTTTFDDFEAFWTAQTPLFNPIGKVVASLQPAQLEAVRQRARQLTNCSEAGVVSYSATANAVRGLTAKL